MLYKRSLRTIVYFVSFPFNGLSSSETKMNVKLRTFYHYLNSNLAGPLFRPPARNVEISLELYFVVRSTNVYSHILEFTKLNDSVNV